MTTNLDIIPFIKKYTDSLSFDSVLDIGCGGTFLQHWAPEHDILNLFSNKEITGIDAWSENIEIRKSYGPSGNYICGVAPKILNSLKRHDIVIAHHVLEHMTYSDQHETMNLIEKLANKLIIIGGPIGYYSNDNVVDSTNNIYERHLDPLNPEDFKIKGFEINIIHPVFLAIKLL